MTLSPSTVATLAVTIGLFFLLHGGAIVFAAGKIVQRIASLETAFREGKLDLDRKCMAERDGNESKFVAVHSRIDGVDERVLLHEGRISAIEAKHSSFHP